MKPTPNATSTKMDQSNLTHALLPALPLLMHSSGDASPSSVDPSCVAFLSQRIEAYIRQLVSAAMDAHDVFTDGEVVGGGAVLGVPPFIKRPRESITVDSTRVEASAGKKRRIDYWDTPLDAHDDVSSEDDDAPLASQRRHSSSSLNSEDEINFSESLCGVLDVHSKRVRKHYVGGSAMDVKSFIFPICHDAALYQRVKEVQAERRRIAPEIECPAISDAVREEGETLADVEKIAALSVGIGSRGSGYVDTWEVLQGKSERDGSLVRSGFNVVAGLVDGDGVRSDWPGANVLESERLW
jgi:hypothetical protein